MSKVIVVTDSTAYIPAELINGHRIQSVPLQVIWGDKVYRDGIDIQPEEFYRNLPKSEVLPTTSQATPADFINLYRSILDEGNEVLSMHISSKLSGTMDSAMQARNALRSDKIELVDSLSTVMSLGFQAVATAELAAKGASLKECKRYAESLVPHMGVYFVVNTLEYLHRGGRIGGAAAFLGTVLNLKPILELRDGRIEAIDKVRTQTKALDRLIDLVIERLSTEKGPYSLATLHADDLPTANALLEKITSRLPADQVRHAVISSVSPVLGTHTGPGAVGIAFLANP